MVVEWEDALIRGLFRAHGCIMHFINKPPFDAHFDARSCLMTPKVTSRCNRAFSSNLMFPVVTPSCMKLHKAKKRIPKPCVGCSNHLGSAKCKNLGFSSRFLHFLKSRSKFGRFFIIYVCIHSLKVHNQDEPDYDGI
jgi:hypothetical protein